MSFVFVLVVQSQAQRRSAGTSSSRGSGGEGRTTGFSSSQSGSSGRAYMFDLQAFYSGGKAEADPASNTGSPSTSNQFETNSDFYSLKLARVYASGWNLAATYAVRRDVRHAVTISGQSQGLGIGYLDSSGASLRVFYHFGEKYGDYSEGQGGSVEMGYYLKLNTQFYLGFLLTHQRIQYFKNPQFTDFKSWTGNWSHPVITFAYSTR